MCIRDRFLADRNILVDQTMQQDFKPFAKVMTKIEGKKLDSSYELYLSLYPVSYTHLVADSDEHRLLMALRDSQLKDGDIREEFYQKIINSLDLGDSNYLILLAHDTYDVPHKNKNDEMDADTSDAVFSYVVCCVCPVKELSLIHIYAAG